MARAPDARVEQAKELFLSGKKLIEIAQLLGVPEGTVRSWKNRYKWNGSNNATLQMSKRNVAKRRGAQPGNRNAVGNRGGAAPLKNKNAEKFGFFSKYLPDETQEIFSAIEQADPLDLLWHQIQIAYAAIIRAQRIAYVKNQQDKTVEKVEKKDGNVIGERWEVQQAWDKQNEFMKAQARAQGELRAMIKQYDEMLHKDWESASEVQKVRIDQMKAQTQRISLEPAGAEDDGVEIINDTQKEAGADLRDHHSEVLRDI